MADDEDVKLAYLNNNLNPLRNSMQLKDTLNSIQSENPRADEMVGNISDALDDIMLDYLKHPRLDSKIIRMQATQKDIFGETVLTYFEEYDAFKLMQTSIIDEVMKDLT